MNEREKRISDYKLERYRLGELPEEELARIEQALEVDEELRNRLVALERSEWELGEKYPPAWMARQIRMRLEGAEAAAPRRFSAWQIWAVPAIVAALMVAVLPSLFDQDPETRIKGLEPQIKLFRKTEKGTEPLADSSLAREGDLVQVVYLAAGSRFGAIYSLDGRGALTQHLPAEGMEAVTLKTSAPDTLNYAYELDDAPRWERFFFVTADRPFRLELVKTAILGLEEKGEDRLALPAGFNQQIFYLKKAEQP